MDNCFEKTPYGSLIALTLIVSGCGLMCGSNFEALRRTEHVFEDRFYPLPELRAFRIMGIVYATVTVVLAVINLVCGTLSTGYTRHKLYHDKFAAIRGRKWSRCLLLTTYFAAFAWLVLFIIFAIPVIIWFMLHRVCRNETDYWRSIHVDRDETRFTYTFNLTNYGLYRRPMQHELYTEYINSPSAFTQLCQELASIGPLFSIALGSSSLVLIGLVCFVACLSSTIVRLKYWPELRQFRLFSTNESALGQTVSEDFALQPLFNTGFQSYPSSTMDPTGGGSTMMMPARGTPSGMHGSSLASRQSYLSHQYQ